MNELTLSTALETALNRIEDMLSDDDGQAFKEARKFLPVGRAALAALRSMPSEPYGQVTVVKRPGCQNQHWFYRWPDPPYLDNAAECVTVYATNVPETNFGNTPHKEAVRMSDAWQPIDHQGEQT